MLSARHVGATEASGDLEASTFNVAVCHHFVEHLFDDTLEWHALLQSFGDHLSNDCGVRFWVTHFLDLDLDVLRMFDLPARETREDLALQFHRSFSVTTDDEAGTRRFDEDLPHLVVALHFDVRHVHATKALHEIFAQKHVALQIFLILPTKSDPARLPVAEGS